MLQKTNIPIPFSQGINTKSDPKQLAIGQWEVMENVSMQVPGEVSKRPAFVSIGTAILGSMVALAKTVLVALFGRELLAYTGKEFYSRSPETDSWVERGASTRLKASTEPLVQSAYNQSAPRYTVHTASGLAGAIYQDSRVSGSCTFYIKDTATGAFVLEPQTVAQASLPFAASIGNYIVFFFFSASLSDNAYIAINVSTPTTVPSPVAIPFATVSGISAVVELSSRIVLVGTSSDDIFLTYLSSTLTQPTPVTITPAVTGPLTINAFAGATDEAWLVFSDQGTTGAIYTLIIDDDLAIVRAAVDTGEVSTAALAGIYDGTDGRVFYTNNDILPDSLLRLSYMKVDETTGAASDVADVLYGAGVGAGPMLHEGTAYMPMIFSSTYQTTCFLVSQSGEICAKVLYGKTRPNELAPSASVQVSSTMWQFPLTTVDAISPVNGTLLTQTGATLVTIEFEPSDAASSWVQASNNLLLSGGLVSMYDGVAQVELGFNTWPEDLDTSIAGATYDCATTSGSATITADDVDARSINPGMNVSGTGIQSNTKVRTVSYDPSTRVATLLLSKTANDTNNPIGLLFSGGNMEVAGVVYGYYATYSWTDEQGNVHQSAPSIIENVTTGGDTTYSTTCDTTSGSNIITDIAGGTECLSVGQGCDGLDIPGSVITEILSSTSVRISNAATGTNNNGAFNVGENGGVLLDLPTLKMTNKINANNPPIIRVYRTTANGGPLAYEVTDPNNPIINDPSREVVEFADVANDAEIIGNTVLYTSQGEVENIPPPSASFLTTYGNRVLAIPTNNESSFYYSKETFPGVPVDFSDLFTWSIDQAGGDIVAAAQMDDKLVLFKETLIFYMLGGGPPPSGIGAENSFSQAQQISSDTGCTEPRSVVSTPVGVMYKSAKGIYLLSRNMSVEYIGAPVEAYNDYVITSALLLDRLNEVRFTTQDGPCLVFNYFQGQWYTFPGQSADAATIWQGHHTLAKGETAVPVVQQTPGDYTSVEQVFETGWLNFAQMEGFQRVYEFILLGEYHSAHTLTVQMYKDFEDTAFQTVTITPSSTDVYEYRVFPSVQKCTSMKLRIVETDSVAGAGMSLSSISLRAGLKTGLNKIKAASSV